MTTSTFNLPDVGEGLTEAEIVSWRVKVGDSIKINDTLLDIETAKSIVEIPSPYAGVIETLHAPEGTLVPVGSALVTITDGAPAAPSSLPETAALNEEPPLVLVGTAPVAPAARRYRLSRRAGTDVPGEAAPAASAPEMLTARETRVPVKGVRRAIATAMTTSAFTAPHVTEWLTIDVTATLELIAELKSDPRFSGLHVTLLLLAAKALLVAVKRYPEINAHWDAAAGEIVTKHYVNLGIAVASPRGLVVPTIKEAQHMDLATLARALETVISTARDGTLSPADMAGGTITITNIGALGVDGGTPILVPGEAAILALGAIRELPWVLEHQIVPRMLTQLAISFDHRVIDGELASNFLTAVAEILTSPARALSYL